VKPNSVAFLAVALITLRAAAAPADVFINGVRLDDATQGAFEQRFHVPLQAGRYWYDKVSGLWGYDGGPAVGQIYPGLPLGGPLRRDASNGHTGVIVNGRELHPIDVAALQRCTRVIPGRYWVFANGVGGVEGGPPQFNLAALCSGPAVGGGLNCDGTGSCASSRTRSGVTGIVTEGKGRAGISYNGKYIMTPN